MKATKIFIKECAKYRIEPLPLYKYIVDGNKFQLQEVFISTNMCKALATSLQVILPIFIYSIIHIESSTSSN